MGKHTPAELQRALEFVAYEIRMLVGALALQDMHVQARTVGSRKLGALAIANALVELRALHARNVSEFLQPKKPKSNFIVAQHYIPEFVATDAAIGRLWVRASTYLAHLTTDRITDDEHARGEKNKAWDLRDFTPLLRATREFVGQLLATDWLPKASSRRDEFREARSGLSELLDAIAQAESRSE